MIIQLDTKNKRVLILSDIKIEEFLRELEKLLPNKGWRGYTIINPYSYSGSEEVIQGE